MTGSDTVYGEVRSAEVGRSEACGRNGQHCLLKDMIGSVDSDFLSPL